MKFYSFQTVLKIIEMFKSKWFSTDENIKYFIEHKHKSQQIL